MTRAVPGRRVGRNRGCWPRRPRISSCDSGITIGGVDTVMCSAVDRVCSAAGAGAASSAAVPDADRREHRARPGRGPRRSGAGRLRGRAEWAAAPPGTGSADASAAEIRAVTSGGRRAPTSGRRRRRRRRGAPGSRRAAMPSASGSARTLSAHAGGGLVVQQAGLQVGEDLDRQRRVCSRCGRHPRPRCPRSTHPPQCPSCTDGWPRGGVSGDRPGGRRSR